MLKYLRQYWCYGNLSVISNRGGWWTFQNLCDIGLFPASKEITETNKPRKHYTKAAAITSAVLLRNRENIRNGLVPLWGYKSKKRCVTSLDLKAKVIRLEDGWQVSGRSTDSLDCSLAFKMIRQQISLTNRQQSTTSTNMWRQWRTRAEHRRFKSGPPLMSAVSVTALILSLNWCSVSE